MATAAHMMVIDMKWRKEERAGFIGKMNAHVLVVILNFSSYMLLRLD
jgi:hypothetical protein